MYFLIDPIYQPNEYLQFVKEIDEAYNGGAAVALASLIKPAHGSSVSTGAKLFIRERGDTEGTLGSPKADRDATNKAIEFMAHGRNDYIVSEDGAEFFVEAYTTPPQIVLCGGGHVSNSIAPLAKRLGFRVVVTDDREEFASEARFPEADIVVAKKPEDALTEIPVNANTFIIIATRGHRYDNVALEAAAWTSARYIGLLGSRRKTILIYGDLISSGVPIERINEIRSPVGLDIHARTPDEIAISIMAEILMFRLGGTGLPMKLEEWRIEKLRDKMGASVGVVD